MARNWIVVGDPTSSGGSVVTGSPFTDIDGLPVARVADQATCPRHGGAFPIADGDSTLIVDGQPVALHGSSLACGCKVLSARQARVFVERGGGARTSSKSRGATTVAAAGTFSAPSAGVVAKGKELHDEAFVLRSKLTGKPLVGRGYRVIRQDGSIEFGATDHEGRTHVIRTDGPELLKVEMEEESPAWSGTRDGDNQGLGMGAGKGVRTREGEGVPGSLSAEQGQCRDRDGRGS